MNALQYLKNRIEYAIKNSKPKPGSHGTIHINDNDINALNQLIEAENSKQVNTQLEDALLLFYVFNFWTLQVQSNEVQLVQDDKNYLLTDAKIILDKLCLLLQPKAEMVKELTTLLQVQQMRNGTKPKNLINEEIAGKLLDEVLTIIKTGKGTISQLKNTYDLQYKHPPLTELQREKFLN